MQKFIVEVSGTYYSVTAEQLDYDLIRLTFKNEYGYNNFFDVNYVGTLDQMEVENFADELL